MKSRGNVYVYLLIGVLAASALGITTDQILQNVYDSSNTALRTNIVAGGGGGGFITGSGTSPDLAAFSSSTGITNYAGTGACGAGTAITALSAAGAATCTAFSSISGLTTGLIPVAASSSTLSDSTSYRVSLANASSTGTTVNKTVKLNSSGQGVIMSAADTAGIFGIVESGAGTTGSAVVTLLGLTNCVSDNSTTTGHYAGLSQSVAGDCTDLGATFPTNGSAVIGTWKETGAAASRQLLFNTPDVSSASAGGNGNGNGPGLRGSGTANLIPKFTNGNTLGNSSITDNGTTISSSEALSIGAFTYNGKLNIADIHSNSSSFTVAHRIEICSGGSGNYTATMPTSPSVGDMYSVVNIDTTHTCILTRAGSQTLNGATTLTLAAYTAPTRQNEHCVYEATNDWNCEGPAT